MRLKQDVVHACDHGLSGDAFIGMARDKNDWRGNVTIMQDVCQIDAVQVRHFVVDHKAIRSVRSECIQERCPAPERFDIEPVRFQKKSQRADDTRIVIDHIYRGFGKRQGHHQTPRTLKVYKSRMFQLSAFSPPQVDLAQSLKTPARMASRTSSERLAACILSSRLLGRLLSCAG